MSNALLDNVDLWTGAVRARSTAGRGSNRKIELVGVKKLRELILELAVRGKLVPQDASDEPASELLKRIEAEKAQLIAAGKIKKQKPLPPVSDDEKPFELPKGWQWVRFGVIAETHTGYAFKSSEYTSEGTLVLRVTNINPDSTIDLTDCKYIAKDLARKNYSNFELSENDVLLVMVGGSLGKIGIVSESALPAVLNQNMWKLVPLIEVNRKYFVYGVGFINSNQINITKSTHGHLSQGEYLCNLFALPPLAEQHRIVAKVDELMQLCDQLEQHTDQQHAAHQQLVETLLDALTQASSAADLAEQWQRIAAHFDGLFVGAMGEWAVDRLKDSILQLAVMGKLVPQDPTDEPASELLKRIEAEKAQLIKDGKIKKQKPLPPVGEDEKPFELPEGWEWVHLVKISNEIGTGPFGSMIHQSDYIEGGVPLINPSHMINDRVVEDLQISVNPEKFKELASYKLITGDIVLARRGEVGRCAVITEREHGWLCGTGSFYLRLSSHISRLFTALVFRVTSTRSYLAGNAVGTTMVNLNHSILNSLPIALPPFAEQHRIVAKVDQLFALCDQLKVRIHTANQLQLQLTDTLIEQTLA